jgi:hypothetical protein
VILFLGDGRQDYGSADGERILELISNRNALLNNSVMIITYGIGTGKQLLFLFALMGRA